MSSKGTGTSVPEMPSLEGSRERAEEIVAAWECGCWHHEAKDGSSEHLSLSQSSASFLGEGQRLSLLCTDTGRRSTQCGGVQGSQNVFLGPLWLNQLEYLLRTRFLSTRIIWPRISMGGARELHFNEVFFVVWFFLFVRFLGFFLVHKYWEPLVSGCTE